MISVCICTYNGAKFIKQQLVSILNQLQNDDEIILSDDGSTDDTLNIVNSLNDKRIRCYIHNKRKNPWKFIGGDEKCFAVSDNFNY